MGALGYGEAPERRLTPAEVSAAARAIAATEGIKYRSARRRIERRRTTAGESRGQPNRAFARRAARLGFGVHAVLRIDVSPRKGQKDMRERRMDVSISGALLEETGFIGAIERADLGAAEGAFFVALMRAYEDVDIGEHSFLEDALVGNVSALDISWGSGDSPAEYDDLPF